MLCLMASIGFSEGNAGHEAYYQAYGREKFRKNDLPLIKKLKWSEEDLNALDILLSSSIGKTRFNYDTLRKNYKNFLNSKSEV